MKSLLPICVLLLVMCSCKTTSRTSSSSQTSGSEITESTRSLSTFSIGDQTFESLTIETTIETPTVVFINGAERVVQQTTTQTQTAVRSTRSDSTFTSIDSRELSSTDTTAVVDSLQRETEGMEVIPDIVEGLTKGLFDTIFGPIGKFITALILMVIFMLLLRYLFQRDNPSAKP